MPVYTVLHVQSRKHAIFASLNNIIYIWGVPVNPYSIACGHGSAYNTCRQL